MKLYIKNLAPPRKRPPAEILFDIVLACACGYFFGLLIIWGLN